MDLYAEFHGGRSVIRSVLLSSFVNILVVIEDGVSFPSLG